MFTPLKVNPLIENYWVNKFSNDLPKIRLPFMKEEAVGRKTRRATETFQVPNETKAYLEKISKGSDMGLLVLLISGLNLVLYKYIGEKEFLVGTLPQKTSTNPDSILFIKNSIDTEGSFKEMIGAVKDQLTKDMKNVYSSFGSLYQNVTSSNDINLYEYLNVALLYDEIHDRPNVINNYDIIISFAKEGEKMILKIEYNSNLYDGEIITYFCNNLLSVYASFGDLLEKKIDDISIVSAEEMKKLLEFSTTHEEKSHQFTLHQLFEEQVERNPQEVAVVFNQEEITYQELNNRANQLARVLQDKGIKAEDVVGIMLDKSIDTVMSILAVLKSGGAYLPIDVNLPVNRIRSMLSDCNAKALISKNQYVDVDYTQLQGLLEESAAPVVTKRREFISDFNQVPYPNRTLVDCEKYNRFIGQTIVKNRIQIQASRGCPYDCAYCFETWDKKQAARTGENIFQEIMIYYKCGIKKFDIFMLNHKQGKRLFQLITENNIKDLQLYFPNGLRGDILTKEYIDLMVEAGTVNLALALETYSPRLQKLIQKHLKLDRFHENIEYICTKYPHVILELFTMHGIPSETEEEALMTLEYVKSLKWVHFPYINVLKIYPNTDMEQIAIDHGISQQAIIESQKLGWDELSDTLPFNRSFSLRYQSEFLNSYILSKDRLLHVIPHQMKIMTESEFLAKYDSYLPSSIKSFSDFLAFTGLKEDDFKGLKFNDEAEDIQFLNGLNEKLKEYFKYEEPVEDALNLLMLDLSQFFDDGTQNMLYDVVEAPLGLIYIMTYLQEKLKGKVNGKILKSRIDFANLEELKEAIKEFMPDVIAIRSLSYYKDFCHKIIGLIKYWFPEVPIIIGGPYTVDHKSILMDKNIDVAVIGEGEVTIHELISEIIKNGKKLPNEEILRNIDGIAFIAEEDKQQKNLALDIIPLDLLEYEIRNKDVSNINVVTTSSNLAYIIYTSGTTGLPKGVMVEHRNVVNVIKWFIKNYNVTSDTNIAQLSDFSFDPSIEQVFSSLIAGSKLFLVDKNMLLDTQQLMGLLTEKEINIINSIPSILREALQVNKKVKSLKSVISGGDKLDQPTRDQILAKGYRLFNHYGPTETTIDAITGECDFESTGIGKPITNVKCMILDENLQLVPLGVKGTIYIGGTGVARGYINDPSLTEEKFIWLDIDDSTKFYNTGDLGQWTLEGTVEFIGRSDNQVKVRGYRIELGEIEEKLKNISGISDAVAVVRNNEDSENVLYVYYVSNEDYEKKYLRTTLSRTLPVYMMPSDFIRLDNLPRLSSGKVDRRALPEASYVESANIIKPRNEMEEDVQKIWAEVLKTPQESISIDANFFEIGGHSLKATLLLSKLQGKFNTSITLSQLFKNPTVENIVQLINESKLEEGVEIQVVEKREYYPLSSAQKRLYFLDKFEDIGTSYNMTDVLSIEGDFDIKHCGEVFRKILNRHDILRTTFDMVDNEPVQKIHDEVDFEIEVFDKSEEEYTSEEVKELINGFIRPYNLKTGLLFRIGVIVQSPKSYVLIFDIHHIIADGTSIGNFINEFVKLYVGEELPPLKIQYKDYSVWQNSKYNSEKLKEQEKFWMEIFSGDIPRLNMPTSKKRPKVFTYKGELIHFKLDKEDTDRFLEMTQENKVTLYMNLLAVYNVLLYNYTHQDDIVVGSGIANRNYKDVSDLIGLFVNSIPLRNYPKREKSFIEFLKEVKENCIAVYENQDLQFEDLVDKLNLQRDVSRNPLFDVCLNVQNFEQEAINLKDIAIKPYQYVDHTAKFDITIYVSQLEGGLDFTLEYYSEIFTRGMMEQFAQYFLKIIKEVTENPEQKIGDIEILPVEVLNYQEKFNDTVKDYDLEIPVHQLVEKAVDMNLDQQALVYNGDSLTYGELDKRSNQLANYLTSVQQIKPDQCIGIYMEKSFDFIVTMLGILKAGGAYVPIDSTIPHERIKEIIKDAEISVVISQSMFLKELNNLLWDIDSLNTYICMDTDQLHQMDELNSDSFSKQVELWDYVAQTSKDDITGGGWINSFTGEPFRAKEMKEYSSNAVKKLEPLINSETKILEIGCGSGLTMFEIAPKVAFYYAIDLSKDIIEKNRQKVQEKGLTNVKLTNLAAHEINQIEGEAFDLVIINSVIQSFPGHNYFKKVIEEAIKLLKPQGRILVGDIMDNDLKTSLIEDIRQFNNENRDKGYKSKLDWTFELFISRDYLRYVMANIPTITDITFTDKIYSIENELTKYRYDALLMIDKENPESKSTVASHKHQVDLKVLRDHSYERPNVMVQSHNLMYVIYTSGTMGKQKGVMVEHRNVVNVIKWFVEEYQLSSHKNVLQLTNFAFDPSVEQIFGALISGSTLFVPSREISLNPQELRRYIQQNDINIINSVPVVIKELLVEQPKIDSIEYVISGGERLDEVTKDSLLEAGYNLYNHYGPTEATIDAITTRAEIGVEAIGKPIANMKCYILNENLHYSPMMVFGELYLSGAGIARGYLKDDELTERKFIKLQGVEGRVYKTGDLARWLPDGRIEFLGRKDSQVKIRGYRIELEEIQYHLMQYPAIREAIVLDRETARGEKYVCAYYVSNIKIDNNELRKYLLTYLPDYMIPKFFIEIETVPLKSNGKINFAQLPQPGEGDGDGNITYPTNEVEVKLREIWSSILEFQQIGITDNFFELGGHSLKAMILTSRISKELNVDLPIVELFSNPTIKGIAQYIKNSEGSHFANIQTADQREFYPLSSAQRRIYMLYSIDKGNVAYNMPTALEIIGKLDGDKLYNAIKVLVQEHESLRTSFEMIDGEPVQRIHEEADFDYEYAQSHGDLKEIINEFVRPFDLTIAPLLRAKLVKIEEENHLLIFDVHHIVSDGVSASLLMKEFFEAYTGNTLPQQKLQYKDFVIWQSEFLKDDKIREQENYWLERFAGEIPVLNLPTDYPRPKYQSFEGDHIQFAVEKEMVDKIKAVATSTGSTLYMYLLTTYNILLSKYTGQEDIIVGSPISGRKHADLESIIGMFVNTLALRNYPRNDMTFIELLKSVKENTLKAFENQYYQFEDLVDKLDIKRDFSRNPIFDTMFVMQNIDHKSIEIKNLNLKMVDVDIGISKFDISLAAAEIKGGISFDLEFCTKLFKKVTMERFKNHFLNVLEKVADNPYIRIEDIELIGDGEKHQILVEFNDTKVDYPREKTLNQLFEEQVEKTPEKIALIHKDTQLTYGELNQRANQVAKILRDKGTLPNTVVGIMVERSIEMMVGIMGILKAGAAYLPIDSEYPIKRIDYMIADSGTNILLTQSWLQDRVSYQGEILLLDDEGIYTEEGSNLDRINTSKDLAYVIYTSGSTGNPKGVMIQHHSVINRLNWMQKEYPLNDSDVILQKTPYSFDVSVWEIFWWTIAGAKVYVLGKNEEKNPKAILEAIEQNGVTTMHFVPSMLNAFLGYLDQCTEKPNLYSLARVFTSGETLGLNQAKKFNLLIKSFYDTRLINLYGPTEATVDVSYFNCDNIEELRTIPIGKPIDNIKLYILDKRGRLQPVGIPGELCIVGDGLARGYLNNPTLTSKKFVDNPYNEGGKLYKTGDLARWMADGNIEFLGRLDHQVKIRGYRIELGEIETQLLNLGFVKEVLVLEKEDENGDKYICAYVVSEEEIHPTFIKMSLSKVLPDYMVPRHIILVEGFSLTPNGKIDRGALPKPEGELRVGTEYEAPKNEIEEALVKIWQEILDVEKIGINDNFSELGGHSLKAINLTARIADELGIDIELSEVFNHQTVKSMAVVVEEKLDELRSLEELLNEVESLS